MPTDTRAVTIRFSEYVERSSLPQALSVTPRFDEPIRFGWSGRAVDLELPSSLRDSTTYLFTLDTNLSDTRGVSLDQPVTIAFATGPRINRGQIQGRVVEPRQAEPQSNVDVYAYALPDSATAPPTPLPARPAYRTQTGQEGTFAFEHLREQRYYVVALEDNNRNRTPDPSESFAVPPRLALRADSASPEVPVPWLLTRIDTLAPRLQRAQPLSRQRLRLGFDEPIRLAEGRPGAWTLRDSVGNTQVAVRSVYASPDRANAVILRTAPMEARPHALVLSSGLVTDTLGRALRPDTARFQAVSRADTTRTRFRAFAPEAPSAETAGTHLLLPGRSPGVRFNQAPDSATLRRVLSLRDTTGRVRPYTLTTEEGRTYRLRPEAALQAGASVEVAVDARPIAGPDTTYTRRFRRVTGDVLGALEGRAVLADTTRPGRSAPGDTAVRRSSSAPRGRSSVDTLGTVPSDTGRADAAPEPRDDPLPRADSITVELIPAESTIPLDRRTLTTASGSTFVFRELPEGTFRFRAFLDRNGNGRWDGGRVRSYVPAEPLTWSGETVDSRPRWTTVVPFSLRVPQMRTAPPPVSAPVPDTATTDSTTR